MDGRAVPAGARGGQPNAVFAICQCVPSWLTVQAECTVAHCYGPPLLLGLGVQEPLTSWGVLISEGSREMETAWWLLIFPGIFMTITLASLNFIGDGLRDAIDPKEY